MRVLVDGWELLPAGQRRGIGRFLEALLPALASDSATDVTVLAVDPDVATEFATTDLSVVAARRRVPVGRVRLGTAEHVLRTARDVRRLSHDVYWSPGTLPPLRSAAPWVQTLHDLAPLVLPRGEDPFNRTQWRLLGRRLHAARRVVAVSRHSADEAIRVLGLDASRIEVVHHGVDRRFRPAETAGAGGYIAVVASDDRRKGLAELAEAVRHRAPAVPVRVAGALTPVRAAVLEGLPGVEVVGHVPDLPAFLREALVVAAPSRHEGFGFVPLEAMASGTPVVAFDNTAVPEVVGDAAVLVADGDTAAFAAALGDLVHDAHARAELRAAGLARAATFTWDRAATAYARILADAA